MKIRSKLTWILGLDALAPLALAAMETSDQAYLDSARQGPGIPTPVSVVAPDVKAFDVGKSARIAFVVDTMGRPSDFSVLSTNDPALAASVIDAVAQWQFEPARVNGVPVAKRVVLPVHVGLTKPDTIFEENVPPDSP
jgi:TonB family protein